MLLFDIPLQDRILMARKPQTHPDDLVALCDDTDDEVLELLSCNRALPAAGLKQLILRGNDGMLSNLSRHPGCQEDHLITLAWRQHPTNLVGLLRHPACTVKVLDVLIKRDLSLLDTVIQHWSATDYFRRQFVLRADETAIQGLISEDALTVELCEILKRHPSPRVRAYVAEHVSMDEAEIQEALQHPEQELRRAVAQFQPLSLDLQEAFLHCAQDEEDKRCLSVSPALDETVALQLCLASDQVRHLVVANPAVAHSSLNGFRGIHTEWLEQYMESFWIPEPSEDAWDTMGNEAVEEVEGQRWDYRRPEPTPRLRSAEPDPFRAQPSFWDFAARQDEYPELQELALETHPVSEARLMRLECSDLSPQEVEQRACHWLLSYQLPEDKYHNASFNPRGLPQELSSEEFYGRLPPAFAEWMQLLNSNWKALLTHHGGADGLMNWEHTHEAVFYHGFRHLAFKLRVARSVYCSTRFLEELSRDPDEVVAIAARQSIQTKISTTLLNLREIEMATRIKWDVYCASYAEIAYEDSQYSMDEGIYETHKDLNGY